MNESTPNLEELAHLLCASGDYRVQRRLSPRSTVTPPDGTPTKSALVIDVETTGLDLQKDEIIELAMIPFTAHFAENTFEVDFVAAGNAGTVVAVLSEIYKDAGTIAVSKEELESGDITRFGTRALTMARYAGKGWFAIILGRMITPETVIPDYILDAIFQAHLPVTTQTWASVLEYRVGVLAQSDIHAPETIAAMREQIRRYSHGEINFAGVRSEMLTAFPADGINVILASF